MPASQHSRWLAYLALAISIFGIGFSAIFVGWANAPGTVVSFYRVAIAAVLLT
jgi:hypothetical protein